MQLTPCQVEFIKGGKVKLLTDLSFKVRGVIITLKAGYIWDMASIPRFARGVIGCPSEFIGESGVHDVLYESGLYPRDICDLILYLLLRSGGEFKDKVDRITAKTIYAGVRVGGESHYKQGSIADAREFVTIEGWL